MNKKFDFSACQEVERYLTPKSGSIFLLLLIVLSLLTALIPLMTDIGSYAQQLMYQQYAQEQKRYILDGLMNAGIQCCQDGNIGRWQIADIPYRQGIVEGIIDLQHQDARYALQVQLVEQGKVVAAASCVLEKLTSIVTIDQWKYD